MSNEITPTNSAASGNKSSCMKAIGISCLVVVIVGLALGFWITGMVSKNPVLRPALRNIYTEAQHITICEMNLREIGGALDRYSRRNGKYPDNLADLYPNFMEKRAFIHCPSDSRSKDIVSYDYTPPSMDAPASTVVIECKRHIIMKNQPPWTVSLYKDGKVIKKAPPYPKTPPKRHT